MIILGQTQDDRGAQLEYVTRRILETMGYANIVLNRADAAGEIDVTAEFVMPAPGGETVSRLICECKARKDPLNMPDWLKFLGKVFVNEKTTNRGFTGCLISLSGVNGHVHGSYAQIKHSCDIKLVTDDVLLQHLSKSHGVAARQVVHAKVLAELDDHYRSMDLVFYNQLAYWLLTYDAGKYTLRDAKGDYLPTEQVAHLISLIEPEIGVSQFIDLKRERTSRGRFVLARKIVLAMLVVKDGPVATTQMAKIQKLFSADELIVAAAELKDAGWIESGECHEVKLVPALDSDAHMVADFLRFFLTPPIIPEALGTAWYDRHINDALLSEACNVQSGLTLEDEQKRRALLYMQWSPMALLYSLTPDPIITAHRASYPVVNETFLPQDRLHFLRSLMQYFVGDFRSQGSAEYFGKVRKITEIDTTTTMVVTRDGVKLPADQFHLGVAVGEWYVGGLWLHMLRMEGVQEGYVLESDHLVTMPAPPSGAA